MQIVLFSNMVIRDMTTPSSFVTSLGEGYHCVIYDKYGNVTNDTAYIGTGMKYVVFDKWDNLIDTETVVVYGDITGDGKVTAADHMKIKRSISDASIITGIARTAADINQDGAIKANDYIRIKHYIQGKYDIYANAK